jgi:hypothetical protein
MALSMIVEIALIVVAGLRVPRDNRIIAPIILVASPIAAGWICGYRRPRALLTVAVVTVLLTIAGVFVVSRLTGVSTGLVEPILVRSTAGWIAASLTASRSGRSNSPTAS